MFLLVSSLVVCCLKEVLDYDVDSDDEWEEEEPGESLSNSEVDFLAPEYYYHSQMLSAIFFLFFNKCMGMAEK